jgi:RimJ/RimL family protein N-acetyltransferase
VRDAHLRPWSPGDAEAVFRAFRSADLDGQGGPLPTLDSAQVWIERWRSVSEGGSACALAIVDGTSAVGGVAVSAIDPRHQTGWVSYWLAADVRGQGLASRATATLAQHAFAEYGLYRLELGHRTNNPASCRVATAAGFLAEGVERGKLLYGGERFDTETHARLVIDAAPDIDLLPIVPTDAPAP